jgi:hypothetical protein
MAESFPLIHRRVSEAIANHKVADVSQLAGQMQDHYPGWTREELVQEISQQVGASQGVAVWRKPDPKP